MQPWTSSQSAKCQHACGPRDNDNTRTHLFNVLLVRQHIIVALVKGFSLVVSGEGQHAEGVDVAAFAARLGEDVLRSEVVQGRVGVQGAAAVPLTKLEGDLHGGEGREGEGRRDKRRSRYHTLH